MFLKTVNFRKLRSIDIDMLCQEIGSSGSIKEPSTVNTSVDEYDDVRDRYLTNMFR